MEKEPGHPRVVNFLDILQVEQPLACGLIERHDHDVNVRPALCPRAEQSPLRDESPRSLRERCGSLPRQRVERTSRSDEPRIGTHSSHLRPGPVVQDQLPCLLDVEFGDLLGGHVKLACEHRDHPGFVLDVLLGFDGRGPCSSDRSRSVYPTARPATSRSSRAQRRRTVRVAGGCVGVSADSTSSILRHDLIRSALPSRSDLQGGDHAGVIRGPDERFGRRFRHGVAD